MQINLPTPAWQSLRVHLPMWFPYFLQSWSQLLQGRLLSRNLWVLQPRREPTLGKVCGLFSPPSTAWSPRRWPRPAGSLGWWPPQWGRSYWQGCQDRSGTFWLVSGCAMNQSPEKEQVWPVQLCWTRRRSHLTQIPTLHTKRRNVLNMCTDRMPRDHNLSIEPNIL